MLRQSLALALATAAAAQTFIVDVNNGAGTHYQQITAAVAAVPDGATLRVRAGTYAPFAIVGKSLTILGDNVNVQSFEVASIAAAQRVVVDGITFQITLRVTGNTGQVHVSRSVGMSSIFPSSITITGSTNVHLHGIRIPLPASMPISVTPLTILDSCVEMVNCSVAAGRPSWTSLGTNLPLPAMAVERSRVALFGTSLTGGDGPTDFYNNFQIGGPGLTAAQSRVDLGPGCVVVGGIGGIDPTGFGGCVNIMREGGPGLRLLNSSAYTATGRSSVRGGNGPCLCPAPCTITGPATQLVGNSTVIGVSAAPQASSVGQAAPGGTLNLSVVSQPQDIALLMIGFSATCADLPFLIDFGGILASPDLPFGVFVTDSAGRASYTLPLPGDFQLDRMMWAQWFTFTGAVLPGKGSSTLPFVARS